MNQRATPQEIATLRCRELALAALGALLPSQPLADDAPPEARFLRDAVLRAGPHAQGPALLAAVQASPSPRDAPLLRAVATLRLGPADLLAAALVAAVEEDPVVGRVIAWLQAPQAQPRPTLGLLARALAPLCSATAASQAVTGAERDPDAAETDALYALAGGAAVRSGLLELDDEHCPLCERTVRMAAPLAAALAGVDTDGPRTLGHVPAGDDAGWVESLPELREAADRWAARLAATPRATLVLRSAHAAEARGFATALAARLGQRAVWFDSDRAAPELPTGIEAWLAITQRLPVFVLQAGPGEVLALPTWAAHAGPVLAIVGLDGGVKRASAAVADWRIPAPGPQARAGLWRDGLGRDGLTAVNGLTGSPNEPLDDAIAQAAHRYRAGYGQITEHAQLTRMLSAGLAPAMLPQALAQAATMTSAGRALDALAMALAEPVSDDALVVSGPVRDELQRALQRCRHREQLHATLGAAARTRACDGVRLLLTGASGTGKSLAAQWLATQLGLPIYRVDLSAMLSKWIGDTEKHLAELLGRAEHADVVLLFDEADTLFGKRTEIATANDRFANAQTNYLLQRIESHAGIVVLTSNSRQRFDPAFVRRLDFIIDFGTPDAQARRALWAAHLGPVHMKSADAGEATGIDATALNRLAALADLAGGHIRNAVLAAAASAQARGDAIAFDDVAAGVRGEYRKLGRTPPLEL